MAEAGAGSALAEAVADWEEAGEETGVEVARGEGLALRSGHKRRNS
jgi:hypothetical protein